MSLYHSVHSGSLYRVLAPPLLYRAPAPAKATTSLSGPWSQPSYRALTPSLSTGCLCTGPHFLYRAWSQALLLSGQGPVRNSPDMSKLVQVGPHCTGRPQACSILFSLDLVPHCTGTPPTLPPGHIQICSL